MSMRTFIAILLASGLGVPSIHAGEIVIVQKGKAFVPSAIAAKVGDSLVFRNDDGVNHNAFSETKGLEFNLQAQAPGASNAVPLTGEGTADIRCAFHPAMHLIVTVTK